MMTKIRVRFIFLVAIAIVTIGCDRATKHVAVTLLSTTPTRSFLYDTIRLEYTENTGAFLGLGADWPPRVRTAVFGVANVLLLIGLGVTAGRSTWPTQALFGASLFIAGGAANLIDRLPDGTVVDFINVGVGPVRTGIFNVADIAITLGVGLLMIERYLSGNQRPTQP